MEPCYCTYGVSVAGPDTMYVYEGKDYSKASESDRKTFDQLLAGELHVLIQLGYTIDPTKYTKECTSTCFASWGHGLRMRIRSAQFSLRVHSYN